MRTILFLWTAFLIIFSGQKAEGCGFSVWEENYRYHLMFPEVFGKGPVMPFHFTSSYWYSSPFEFDEMGKDKNCAEWAKTDKNRHTPGEWKRALYEENYGQLIANDDSFVRRFLRNQDPEVLATFLYIKKIESMKEVHSRWVSDDTNPENYEKELIKEGETLYAKTRSKALKCRIAFQLIRIVPDQKFNQFYQNYLIPVQDHSITGTWALRPIAGYYQRMDDDAQANVMLARLFVRCDEWKYWAFEYYTRRILSASLKKAETKDDREALLVLDALKRPSKAIKSLKDIYAANPDNSLIDMLLMREINKMEDLLYTPIFTKNDPAVYGYWHNSDELPSHIENRLYAKQLREFVWKEAVGRKKNSAFWNLSASYLALLSDERSLAKQFLVKSEKCPDFKEGIQIQWITLQALLKAKDKQLSRDKKREDVAALFLSLDKKLGANRHAPSVKSNLALVLANTFHGAGDQVMAAYCFGHAQHYHSDRYWFFYGSEWAGEEYWYDEDAYYANNWAGSMQFFFYLEREAPTQVIDDIAKQLKNKELSGALAEFMEPVRANLYRVYDLLGTRHFAEKNYQASLQAFDKIPDIWWDTCKWNVYKYFSTEAFESPIEFIRSPLEKTPNLKKPNKCIIADSMYRWTKTQSKLKGNEAAVCQFKIANLLLNTSSIGGAWAMSRYWKVGEFGPGEYGYTYKKGIEKQLDEDYFEFKSAKTWYLKAYQSSSDPEMRASCLARAAYCEDDIPFFIETFNGKKRKIRFSALSPSLQKLLKEYPEMAASVYSACPGFDDFFARR